MITLKKETYTEFSRAYTENLLYPTSSQRLNTQKETQNLINELLKNQTLEKFKNSLTPQLHFTKESQLTLTL